MNRGFESIGELNAVGVAAINRRTNDHSDSAGGMRNQIIGGHDVFLRDDLGAGRINQWLVVGELQCFKISFGGWGKISVTIGEMNPKNIVASYLVIQAAGTTGWLALLFWVRGSVRWFQPGDWPANALLGFWLADFVLLVGGSIGVAGAMISEKSWAGIAIWSLAAAVWYPTLCCIGSDDRHDWADVRSNGDFLKRISMDFCRRDC